MNDDKKVQDYEAAAVEAAFRVFEDSAVAKHWLQSPNLALGGQRPIEMLSTQQGYRNVRRVLNAIATGGAA